MDKNLKRKIEKVTKNNGDVSLAQLETTIDLMDKIEELKSAIESIPETIIPEYPEYPEHPEFPSSFEVTNIPEVQKVELINPPKEKDDKEQLKLLKQIADELKKKEDYAYDIEIDAALKEQLKGEPGTPGEKGKDGTEITALEVASKLESLEGEDKLDISAIKGAEELVLDIVKDKISKIPKPKITGGFRDTSSSSGVAESFETVSKNLDSSGATLTYTGDNLTSIEYANGITKTLSYTGDNLTSVVLSGSTPSGISLTKTLTYTGDNLTGVAYS